MLAIVPSLLAFLALASSSYAQTWVKFDGLHVSYKYLAGGGGLTYVQNQATEAACQAAAAAHNANSVAYIWSVSGGTCYACTSYPPTCSGVYPGDSGHIEGIIDRCGCREGHKMYGDGTCIYTGGAAVTDTTYATACPTTDFENGGTPAPLASPAYKKKRNVVEQSAFVGGKVCPIGEQACPLGKGFGCINVRKNLSSCGGCIGGSGVDCSDIIGANEVACERGSCVVQFCTQGFTLSPAGQCLKK